MHPRGFSLVFLFFFTRVAKHKLDASQSAQTRGEAARHRPVPLVLRPERVSSGHSLAPVPRASLWGPSCRRAASSPPPGLRGSSAPPLELAAGLVLLCLGCCCVTRAATEAARLLELRVVSML